MVRKSTSGPRNLIRLNADELQKVRRNLELTYPELAEKAAISVSTIQRALKGEGVSIVSARSIAAALGLTADVVDFEVAEEGSASNNNSEPTIALKEASGSSEIFNIIFEMSEHLSDAYKSHEGVYIDVNQIFLYEVAAFSAREIDRLNLYHRTDGGHHVQSLRTGAIICCEICKRKPIWLIFSERARDRDFETIAAAASTINEMFGLNVALAFSDLDADRIPREIYDQLIYQLVYRQPDYLSLSIALEVLRASKI